MEPRNFPASILPIAEVCPGVLDLVGTEPYLSSSADALWRQAFALGASPPTAHTVDAYKKARERLTDLMAVDVEDAIASYQMAVRAADPIPSAHRFRYAIDSDLEGRVPGKGDVRISATVDCAWVVTPGPSPEQARAVVLQHELLRLGAPAVTDLDLAFAGIAMATLYGVDRMQVGRCIHQPGKQPVYKWSEIIDSRGMDALWSRIVGVFRRKPRALVMSDLCERCPLRRGCPQWMLPVLHGAGPVFKMLTGLDGPIAANDVGAVRRFAKSLREAADAADGHLRAMKREGVG